jgi:hypothetical protein
MARWSGNGTKRNCLGAHAFLKLGQTARTINLAT